MYPTFWNHRGDAIACKRGRWFLDEHTPIDEDLADELEDGYHLIKPWRVSSAQLISCPFCLQLEH